MSSSPTFGNPNPQKKSIKKTTLSKLNNCMNENEQSSHPKNDDKMDEVPEKKKSRSKKTKRAENVVKSSFSKFNALEKRNLIHNPQNDGEWKCRLCSKPVYKMEEIKAEKSIFHKNCFRCETCKKQLSVDNYQSHEGIVYCMIHFKLLFAPKCVEETEPEKNVKPELIIRESHPIELPPDVVRASDKPNLGLEELQQLNVRSKFQVFENGIQQKSDTEKYNEQKCTRNDIKRTTSILSKLAKLKAVGLSTDNIISKDIPKYDDSSSKETDSDLNDSDTSDIDSDLYGTKKQNLRNYPIGIGRALKDIQTKFENGILVTKEERREERKQEIQNIRSRLFLGKQARIKEMYQQAVADSTQAVTVTDKKPEIELNGAARNIKELFEKGEVYNKQGLENVENISRVETDVFESAICKESRNIFMELDANSCAEKDQKTHVSKRNLPTFSYKNTVNVLNDCNKNEQKILEQNKITDVIKYDEKSDDVVIETSEISSKFKFFETYKPTVLAKEKFRITPPREGVVKMPTPPREDGNNNIPTAYNIEENNLKQEQTTAKMINKFRELESNKQKNTHSAPKPLKNFTPPPDDVRRLCQDEESDLDSLKDDDEYNEESEEFYENEIQKTHMKLLEEDEALKEAQMAAHAKKLKAKFEKWEANEIQKEINEGKADLFLNQMADNTALETTKSIRERFENLKSERKVNLKPRYQVNRFV